MTSMIQQELDLIDLAEVINEGPVGYGEDVGHGEPLAPLGAGSDFLVQLGVGKRANLLADEGVRSARYFDTLRHVRQPGKVLWTQSA